MGLPPATPVPSRFLTSKRPGTQQSQGQTPDLHTSNGPRQFRATPRFSSTPRPASTRAAWATPALAISTRVSRSRSTQDIIDDSSPISLDEGSPSRSAVAHNTLPEPIEFDSSLVTQSLSPEETEEGRSPKRRRLSVATLDDAIDSLSSSQQPDPSLPGHGFDNVEEDEDDLQMDDDANVSPTQSPASSSPSIKAEEEPEIEDLAAEARQAHLEGAQPIPNKPAFRSAPRFKPAEPPDTFLSHPDTYLTDIFSPQRRGPKYVAGGIAAELRDWLVDVKGGVDGEREVRAASSALRFDIASATIRLVVEEVSHAGPGMTLIRGRSGSGNAGSEQGAGGARVVLAGEGNIEGLGSGRGGGNRSLLKPGAVVAIAPPAWDIDLNGPWAVAYRWEVLRAPSNDGLG